MWKIRKCKCDCIYRLRATSARDLEWHKTECWAHRNMIERFIVREGTNATVPLTIVVCTIAQKYKWLLHNFERINQVTNVSIKENARIKECSLMQLVQLTCEMAFEVNQEYLYKILIEKNL